MNDYERAAKKEMCAIRHKKTKKWVYGTDYRYSPVHQRTSLYEALIFENQLFAEFAFKERRCSEKLYEIVPVELKAVEQSNADSFGIMVSKNVGEPWKLLSPAFESREAASDFFRENLDHGKWLFRIVEIRIISQNMLY